MNTEVYMILFVWVYQQSPNETVARDTKTPSVMTHEITVEVPTSDDGYLFPVENGALTLIHSPN